MNIAPKKSFGISSVLPLRLDARGNWTAGTLMLLSAKGVAPVSQAFGLERAIIANQREHLALLSATPTEPKQQPSPVPISQLRGLAKAIAAHQLETRS